MGDGMGQLFCGLVLCGWSVKGAVGVGSGGAGGGWLGIVPSLGMIDLPPHLGGIAIRHLPFVRDERWRMALRLCALRAGDGS